MNIQVLVVNDATLNPKSLEKLAHPLDLSIEMAQSGAEALKKLEHHRYALIIINIDAPLIEGIKTTHKIRATEDGHRTPIIALTHHKIEDKIVSLLLSDLDDCLSSPITREQLTELKERWIKNSPPPQKHDADRHQEETIILPKELIDIPLSIKLAQGNKTLAIDLLTMMLNSLASYQKNIAIQQKDQEYERLYDTVHKLYGGCCYCGVPSLKNNSAQLNRYLNSHLNNTHEREKFEHTKVEEMTSAVLNDIKILVEWYCSQTDIARLFDGLQVS